MTADYETMTLEATRHEVATLTDSELALLLRSEHMDVAGVTATATAEALARILGSKFDPSPRIKESRQA